MVDSGEGASGAVEIDPQGAVIASNEVQASCNSAQKHFCGAPGPHEVRGEACSLRCPSHSTRLPLRQKSTGQAYQPLKQISHASPSAGQSSAMVMAALQRSLGSSDTAPTQQQPQPRTQNGKKVVAVVQPKSHMAPRSKVDYSREMTQSPGRGRRYESRHQLQEAAVHANGLHSQLSAKHGGRNWHRPGL